jgi:hypothetical protein
MKNQLFFSYYFIALREALEQDNVNNGFLVKSPNWFYPKELYQILEEYEESHYDEFPLLEKVSYYFDAKSHGFSNIGGVNIVSYRQYIIKETKELAIKLGVLL